MDTHIHRFVVVCANASTGVTMNFIYAASSAQEAKSLAESHGFVVQGVAPIEAEFGGSPELSSYRSALARRRRKRRGGLDVADFFMFRSFVFPVVMRLLFALATILVFVAGPVLVLWRATSSPPLTSIEWRMLSAYLAGVFLGWLVLRMIFELWTLLFRISEQIGEMIQLQKNRR